MRLLIIRHAIAEEYAELTGRDDAARPLTEEGREKMRRGAAGLRALVPELAVLATSALARAVQTAAIVAEAYDGMQAVVVEDLAPGGDPAEILRWLRAQSERETVAIVGHEPSLSRLASWLLTGEQRSILTLKKGAACLLELGAPPRAGEAQIAWLLQPAQLRALA